jgi:hypothetical protein
MRATDSASRSGDLPGVVLLVQDRVSRLVRSRRRPTAPQLPEAVWINQPEQETPLAAAI